MLKDINWTFKFDKLNSLKFQQYLINIWGRFWGIKSMGFIKLRLKYKESE